MSTHRYVENDIGRALTDDQMAEYREVHKARAAGADLRLLTWAARVGVAGILALAVFLVLASL